jgi:flagellin
MIINHNLSAINAHRHFSINVSQLDKNLEKLSSGLRINSGADDAAGLAVSEKMRAQVRGYHQASKNIQDAISLIHSAEGYLSESNMVLQRMRELTVQSANGTYTREDRSQINVEIDQMIKELNRIHEDSKFNTLRLLDGYTLGANSFGGNPPIGEIGTARNPNFNSAAGPGLNGLVIQSGANTDERMFVEVDSFNTYALGLTDQPGVTYRDLNGVNNDHQVWRERSFYDENPINLDDIMYLEAAITPPVADVNIDLLSPQAGNRVDITTSEKSTETIATIDIALNKVNKQRADLGGFENRLEMAMRGVDMSAENIGSAESRIRDADMAKEFVNFTKNQILSQSSSSMIAQANSISQLVFRILG